MFENLQYEEIKKMEKATFKVLNVAEAVELELSEVSPKNGSETQEYFSLLFKSPIEYYFPQSLYLLHHDEFGEGEIFIVPIGKDERNFSYEAVFNRFLKD